MEGYFSTDQSPQWPVVPMEEEIEAVDLETNKQILKKLIWLDRNDRILSEMLMCWRCLAPKPCKIPHVL